MAQFVVDLLDSSGNPIGDGPLQNVLSVSVTSKLDEAGPISFTVPSTDTRASALIDSAASFRIRLSSGAVHYGVLDGDQNDVASEQPTRTVNGFDMLIELQHYSMGWWCFYDDQDLNTVVFPQLVADTPWSLGTIDAALGTLYYRFDGDSRLTALLKIAQTAGKHFRLGSAFRTFDFGAFGAAATVRFTNVDHALVSQDTNTEISIIGSLQIINDRAPVVNRIIPWGAGQDGGDTNRAKVSLFHLTPGDSRWGNIHVKAGMRGAITQITEVTSPHQLRVVDTTGFLEFPIQQAMWVRSLTDLTQPKEYDFIINEIIDSTHLTVRGSPTLPTLEQAGDYLVGNPQLYIQDDTAYTADPREAVLIFEDVTLTDLSLDAFELAASQLYNRAYNYLQTHKIPQTSYAVTVFNCPDALKVGHVVQIVYRGVVTRDGAVVKWVDLNDTFSVINITRTFNADGSTLATVEISNIVRQPTDSSTALADNGVQVGAMGVTVGAPSVSSVGGGGGGSGGAGDPLTFALPLVRTVNNITLPLTVPAANVRNVLGIDNGETVASTKTALDATDPTTISAGAAASPGTALVFAHRDHAHGAPSTWPPSSHNVLDSGYHGDVLTGSITRGDLLYGNATPKIARLALGGITGSLLGRNATDVEWSTLAKTGAGTVTLDSGNTLTLNALTTLGDTWYHDGTNIVRLPGNTATTLKVLTQVGTGSVSAAPSWQTPSIQGVLNYYLTNSAADVATYDYQTSAPQVSKVTLTFNNVNTTRVLQNFITPAGIPNLTSIPAGEHIFHIHCDSSSVNTIDVYAEIWEANSAGVDIALIGTTETTATQGGMQTSETEYELSFSTANVYNMASAASRIVCRVWALRASGSHDMHLYVGGTADSHIELPGPTVDASVFVPYSGATANVDLGTHTLTAGQIIDSGVTASTFIYSNASKQLTSLANAAGVLTNDGAGNFSYTAAGSGTVTGTGTATRIAEWASASGIQNSTLVKSGVGVLTLSTGVFSPTFYMVSSFSFGAMTTAVSSLTITESSGYSVLNFRTDTEILGHISVLGNKTLTVTDTASVSGTNTGDQDLSGYVPTSRTVNSKALSGNITLGLASADFVNQGTVTTVLHGNTAGNPAWGAVVEADLTLADNTTANASTTAHGFAPKAVAPAAGTLNYLGINNSETISAWKSANSNPGAAAAILATDASGYLQLVRLGIGITPYTPLHVNGDVTLGDDTGGAGSTLIRQRWFGGAIKLQTNSGAASDRGLQLGVTDNSGTFFPYITMLGDGGNVTLASLAGTGSRAVLADASGVLSAPVSDVRAKKNIETIGGALEIVSQLRGVRFNYRTEMPELAHWGDQREIGVIAQEVEQWLPEVIGMDAQGYKTVRYDVLTAVLINAVRELKDEVESLKGMMAA